MDLGPIGLAAAIAYRASLGHRRAGSPANRPSGAFLAVLGADPRAFALAFVPRESLPPQIPVGPIDYDPRHSMNPRSHPVAVTGRVLSPNYWYRPRARPSRCSGFQRRHPPNKWHFSNQKRDLFCPGS